MKTLRDKEIGEAIKRGWRHDKNESKILDMSLVIAIWEEVEAVLRTRTEADAGLREALVKILGLYERFKHLDEILLMDSDDPFRRFAKEAWQEIKASAGAEEERHYLEEGKEENG